jgi:outer membrane murein-binding lipoprotein Lpp
MDPLEYLVKKMGGLETQVEALNSRIDALEKNANGAADKKNQESL